jgi:hypothetical protein
MIALDVMYVYWMIIVVTLQAESAGVRKCIRIFGNENEHNHEITHADSTTMRRVHNRITRVRKPSLTFRVGRVKFDCNTIDLMTDSRLASQTLIDSSFEIEVSPYNKETYAGHCVSAEPIGKSRFYYSRLM